MNLIRSINGLSSSFSSNNEAVTSSLSNEKVSTSESVSFLILHTNFPKLEPAILLVFYKN
jgi:hypothetical protein